MGMDVLDVEDRRREKVFGYFVHRGGGTDGSDNDDELLTYLLFLT